MHRAKKCDSKERCIALGGVFFVTALLLNVRVQGQENRGECMFNDYVVNSSTFSSFFPKTGFCDTIIGSVRIDDTTDLTHQQLTDALGQVMIITGNLTVVNTAFTNLSFLISLYSVSNREDESEYKLVIVNNSKLETMNGALPQVGGSARIENNPMLDPNCTHVYLNYRIERRIRRNRINCGCELDGPLTNINIDELDNNCEVIVGNLILRGADLPSSETLTRKFANATLLTGEISIVGTNYTDLSFLKNVRKIEDYLGSSGVEALLRIENNTALERLSWPKLEDIIGAVVRIVGNPKLCYTIRELNGLLTPQPANKLEGIVCQDVEPEEIIDRVCRIGGAANLSVVPSNCWILVGHLTLDDQSRMEDFWKLYNVTKIYGGLAIRNSSLKSFSALWQLRRIHSFADNQTAFAVESNANLKSIYLPKLEKVMSPIVCPVMENPNLSISEEDCLYFNETTGAQINFQGNKDNCQGIKEDSGSSAAEYILVLLLSLTMY